MADQVEQDELYRYPLLAGELFGDFLERKDEIDREVPTSGLRSTPANKQENCDICYHIVSTKSKNPQESGRRFCRRLHFIKIINPSSTCCDYWKNPVIGNM